MKKFYNSIFEVFIRNKREIFNSYRIFLFFNFFGFCFSITIYFSIIRIFSIIYQVDFLSVRKPLSAEINFWVGIQSLIFNFWVNI
uniref:Uncharacterized protein n=1 Tax=virus sp. ctkyY8 TaxID=2827995 RepID=A0A8S5REV9_9VIRU|nr:MAG TPA: hypothetical protein [virus sp. ctkyY8]